MNLFFISENTSFKENLKTELSKINISISDFSEKIDMVITDKNISEENTNLLKINQLGLEKTSLPDFIYSLFKNKTRVVIAGDFYAEQTIAMLLHTMRFYNIPVSYFIDNQLVSNKIVIDNDAEFVLIQASEKDLETYFPTVAFIADFQEEKTEKYAQFIKNIVNGGIFIYNGSNEKITNLAETAENPIRKIDFQLPDYQIVSGKTFINTSEGELPIENTDENFVAIVEATKWICQNIGIDEVDFYEALASFQKK